MTYDQRVSFEQPLAAVAKAESARRSAVEQTRVAMVRFGEDLADIIEALPREHVDMLGLQVRLAARGTPTVSSSKLKIETLPAFDVQGYEIRPGATALYVEALGSGHDRQYVEVRSAPGLAVLVDSSLERFETMVNHINGIRLDGEAAYLLACHDGKPQEAIAPGWLFGTFLGELRFRLERAARFNSGIVPP